MWEALTFLQTVTKAPGYEQTFLVISFLDSDYFVLNNISTSFGLNNDISSFYLLTVCLPSPCHLKNICELFQVKKTLCLGRKW